MPLPPICVKKLSIILRNWRKSARKPALPAGVATGGTGGTVGAMVSGLFVGPAVGTTPDGQGTPPQTKIGLIVGDGVGPELAEGVAVEVGVIEDGIVQVFG